jgi:hypothetical protein
VSSASRSPLSRSDIEPFFGVSTGAVCGVTAADGGPTLLVGEFRAAPRQSQGMLFGEPRAFAKRLGSPAQG